MIAKVTLFTCFVAAVLGRPDQPAPPAYGYPAPSQPFSYSPAPPPPPPVYAPPQPTYKAPEPTYKAPEPTYAPPAYEPGMPFDFGFEVVDQYSGNDFGHSSNSDGKVTEGEYRVALPDGRIQVVKYTADNYNGYVAEVSYEGEAQYPEQPAPAPTNAPPAPTYAPPAPTYASPAKTYGAPSQ